MFCEDFVLTIAGFDPSAGAGILADIKTFEYSKVYGQAVCTALTIQNENNLKKINWLTWAQIKSQLIILSKARTFSHAKIGIVENSIILEKILKWLRRKYPNIFIIWDPILKSSSGFKFHEQKNVNWKKLLCYINLVTPNLSEAEFLGISKGSCKTSVLVKGGHSLNKEKSEDMLFLQSSDIPIKFSSKRVKEEHFGKFFNLDRHGSGCVLSALIIANIVKYNDLKKAIRFSKKAMLKFFKNGSGKLGSLC